MSLVRDFVSSQSQSNSAFVQKKCLHTTMVCMQFPKVTLVLNTLNILQLFY